MKLPANCQAVCFDAGGTLFRPWPSVGELYARVAERYGRQVSPPLVEAQFQKAWRARNGGVKRSFGGAGGDGEVSLSGLRRNAVSAGRVCARAHQRFEEGQKRSERSHAPGSPTTRFLTSNEAERAWWRSLVWSVFEPLGGVPAFEAFFEELYDLFARAEAWRLYPETLPVLSALKAHGLKVGMISNWDSRLVGLCEQMGVRSYLDTLVVSAAVGVAKPHPAIFQEAIRRLDIAPRHVVHVGDSIDDDYVGASQAGLSALWLHRDGTVEAGVGSRGVPVGWENIPTIRSLTELLD